MIMLVMLGLSISFSLRRCEHVYVLLVVIHRTKNGFFCRGRMSRVSRTFFSHYSQFVCGLFGFSTDTFFFFNLLSDNDQ
jgi:hypothetical protein